MALHQLRNESAIQIQLNAAFLITFATGLLAHKGQYKWLPSLVGTKSREYR